MNYIQYMQNPAEPLEKISDRDIKLAKINDKLDREVIESEKEWLRNWYQARLPILKKENLLSFVNKGLNSLYFTPSRFELDPENAVMLEKGTVGAYLPPFQPIKLKGVDNGATFYTKPTVILDLVIGTTPLHEFTHATHYGGTKTFNSDFTNGKDIQENQTYLERPDELHSRIMQLRYINKLTPEKTNYTIEDVKKLHGIIGDRNILLELKDGGMSEDDIKNALNTWASNLTDPYLRKDSMYYAKSGGTIKIKKKNVGSFTRYCNGKVTEECIRKGKNSSNPTTRKRANFAANARKWKHEDGGTIDYLNYFE